MKNTYLFIILFVVTAVSIGSAHGQVELKDDKDKVSYSVGFQVGSDFKQQGMEIKPEIFLEGVKDSLAGEKPLMSLEEIQTTLMALKEKVVAAMQKERLEKAEKNLKVGQDYLAENKKKEGIITLPSGLQYKVIKEGTGAMPKATDTVTVNYRGTLIDGTEFDSSYKRKEPVTFQVNGVIPAWTEALQLMKEGAKWQLFIPSELAYGERGAGAVIEPNSTLLFDVELISLNSAPAK